MVCDSQHVLLKALSAEAEKTSPFLNTADITSDMR